MAEERPGDLWREDDGDALGGDAARAEAFGDLHGKLAGDAGGAEDEHAFAGDKLGARGERNPGGHGRVGDAGGGDVIQAVGERDAHSAGGADALGKGAPGVARAAEVDARAVGEAANAVDTGNEGQLAGRAVMGAVGQGLNDAVQAGGGDGDGVFAGFGRGVGEGRVRGWCIEGADYGGFHEGSLGLLLLKM